MTLAILPPALIASVQAQRVTLFLGAGASMEASDAIGGHPPNGRELANLLAYNFFGSAFKSVPDLMTIAEMAIASHGEPIVFEFVRKILDVFRPSPGHLLIPKFRWRGLATTNYDFLIERAYLAVTDPLQNVVP